LSPIDGLFFLDNHELGVIVTRQGVIMKIAIIATVFVLHSVSAFAQDISILRECQKALIKDTDFTTSDTLLKKAVTVIFDRETFENEAKSRNIGLDATGYGSGTYSSGNTRAYRSIDYQSYDASLELKHYLTYFRTKLGPTALEAYRLCLRSRSRNDGLHAEILGIIGGQAHVAVSWYPNPTHIALRNREPITVVVRRNSGEKRSTDSISVGQQKIFRYDWKPAEELTLIYTAEKYAGDNSSTTANLAAVPEITGCSVSLDPDKSYHGYFAVPVSCTLPRREPATVTFEGGTIQPTDWNSPHGSVLRLYNPGINAPVSIVLVVHPRQQTTFSGSANIVTENASFTEVKLHFDTPGVRITGNPTVSMRLQR
jgi:hypothetical protein